MKKKVLTIAIALALCLGLLAVPAMAAEEVKYVEYSWDEATSTLSSTEKTVTDYTIINSTNAPTWWEKGWYVVTGNVTINSRVHVNGRVNLILTDGCTLTIPQGIAVQASGRSLTIYGQTAGTGKLNAGGNTPNECAGIGGGYGDSNFTGSPVTIHGGIVRATGGWNAAGIGGAYDSDGGNFTLYNGTVTAQSGSGTNNKDIGQGTSPGLTHKNTIQTYGGVLYASSFSGDKITFDGGIVIRGSDGTVYGNTTLKQDLTITNLSVPKGASLTIPENVTLTNNGTLTIYDKNSLNGAGTLVGSGRYVLTPTITVPENLVYTGQDQTGYAKSQCTLNTSLTVMGKTFTSTGSNFSTTPTISPEVVKDAGNYTVTSTYTTDGGGTGTVTNTFTVAKADLKDVTASQYNAMTYNGKDQRLSNFTRTKVTTPVGGEKVTFAYSLTEGSGYSPDLTLKNAGTYTVYYKASAANHNDATGSFTMTVDPFTLMDSNVSVSFESMTYNGKAQTPKGKLVVTFLDGSSEEIGGLTWSSVTNVNDTTSTTVPQGNFNTKTITKSTGMKPLNLSTVSVEKANDLTYNGGEQTQQITVKLGETTLAGYTVSGNTATTVKTDGKYTLTVSAGENANYTGSYTMEWNISPKSLTVTAVIPETWWGDAPEITGVTVTSGTLYSPDTVTVTDLTAAPVNAADVGDSVTFAVDSTNAVISGSGIENYHVTVAGTATGKVKVIPLTITDVKMAEESYVYDGTAVSYDNTGLTIDQPGGIAATPDDLVYTYTGTANDNTTWNSPDAPTKAGSYTLTVSHSDTVHYSGSQSVNFTIERKPVEVPVQAAAVTYNGTAQTYAVTETEYYSVTGGVQTAANEAGYVVTISLKDSNNTCWVGGSLDNLTHSFVINKAPVTVTAKNQSYHVGTELPDRSAPELGKHYTVDGLFGEDNIGTVTMKYQKEGEDVTPDINKTGAYDIIMVVTDANSNYDITYVNGKLTYYYTPTYTPTVIDTEGGDVTISSRYPTRGQTVTITPKPDEGMMVDTVTVTDNKGNEIEVTKNSNGTYCFRQPAGSVTITVTFKPEICPSEAYTDLDTNAWYHDAVDYVLHKGLMNGVGNGKFDPNGTTSRAMIVTILWRLEGEPVCGQGKSGTFVDVPEYQWHTEAIEWAAANGIVEGWGGKFDPDGDITREQFATILWRYAKYKGYDVSVGESTNILSYNDAFDISEWAIPAMQWACGAGIMEGDGVNLTPKADATRTQAAALFQRFCENVAEK